MIDYKLTVLLGTHNRGKVDELRRVLEPLGVKCLTADELKIELTDADETGSTFLENARIKAELACRESGMACISDDSGLVVDALDGRPGIYTARYGGGHDVPFEKKIPMLLDEMKNVPLEKRTARFVCAVSCVFPDGEIIETEGFCEGYIGFVPKGAKGFGFDPIFYVGEKSFAELTKDEKDEISHRGNALRLFAEKLKESKKIYDR